MNKERLLAMVENASLTYRDQPRQITIQKKVLMEDRKTDVQYYISISEDTLSLSFRGTDSLKDLMTDLRIWRQVIPYGNPDSKVRVHRGFLSAYKSPGVRDAIHPLLTPEITYVQITGHSYGAALAVLCALDLEYHFPEKDYEVALFGCPRVGNRAFQKSYNKRIIKTLRVENGNDLITKLPPALFGFRHVGTRIHLGLPRIYGCISLSEHSIREYYRRCFRFC